MSPDDREAIRQTQDVYGERAHASLAGDIADQAIKVAASCPVIEWGR